MKKRTRIPWSETPAGKEALEFEERAKLGRPKVDESLCFICQEKPPTHEARRGAEKFQLCDDCAKLVEQENRLRNRVKQALFAGGARNIFEQTLGANLMPTRIEITKIGGEKK